MPKKVQPTSYFSTFISGSEAIVKRALTSRSLQKFKILRIDDGIVVYHTTYSVQDIRQIRFFNNSFILLRQFERLGVEPFTHLFEYALNSRVFAHSIAQYGKEFRWSSFKIVTSHENQTVTSPPGRSRLERVLTEKTNLRPKHTDANVEIWFLVRRGGYGCIGLRVTKYAHRGHRLAPGELAPELAHLLCLVSQPRPSDIFLDPFAGNGAIPLERAIAFPYRKIIAADNDAVLVRRLKSRIERLRKPAIYSVEQDVLTLRAIADASITTIVTDPPWGAYREMTLEPRLFFRDMLTSFWRVLIPGGIVVVLNALKEEFETTISRHADWRMLERHHILVSGKKAAIYKIRKDGG